MSVLLGKKLGMSRIFTESGKAIPVTAIEAGTNVVTQIKTPEKDGYSAVQVGFGTARHPKKPQTGHSKAVGHTPQFFREFRVEDELTVGQTFDATTFKVGDHVKLTATSKGKGFAGVIKKHNFHRGPQTHGSDHHRAPGSIGSMFPQHVLKGKKMPGKMGNDQVSVRKVEIVDIDPTTNTLFVKGPVPGVKGGLVEISLM